MILVLLGLAASAILLLWLTVCYRSPHLALILIVGVVVFGSHALALAYTAGAPPALLRPALAVKDAMAWTLLFALTMRAVVTRTRIAPALFVVLAVGLIVGFLLLGSSPAPLQVQLESVRGALVPVVSLGCAAFLTGRERERAAVGSVHLVTVGAAYALIELLLPRSFVTGVVGVGRYWTDVKQVPLFVDPESGLPYNFSITSGFPRLTGAFGDPLSAGTILGVCLVLALAYRRRTAGATTCSILLAAALLLTFTRAGWVLAVVGVVVLLFVRLGAAQAVAVSVGGAVVVALTVLSVPPLQGYLGGVLGGSDSSTLAHQDALALGARLTFSAWGEGWGTGGTVAQNSFGNAVSAESTYVALLLQIGVVGTVLVGLAVVALAVSALRGWPLSSVGAVLLVALALTSIVSENMLTFNGGFPVFVGAVLLAAAPVRRRAAEPARVEAPRTTMPRPLVTT